jgi:hypothetical protein
MATGAPQVAQIQLWDSTKFFNYKTIKFKGDWIGEAITGTGQSTYYPAIPYASGDLVSYGGQIWQSLQNSNYNHTPVNGSYWKPIGGIYDTDPSGYSWIRMSFYLDNGVWKDIDTSAAFSYNSYFSPNSLRVSITNQNTYTPATTKYISISEIHADQYTGGYIEPSGSTLLKTGVSINGNSYLGYEDSIGLFNNNTVNGWLDGGIQNNTNSFGLDLINQSALDAPLKMLFDSSIVPSTITPHQTIFIDNNINNLNINTAYVEIEIKETLSTKGTPIVSM